MQNQKLKYRTSKYAVCYPKNQTGTIKQSKVYKLTNWKTDNSKELFKDNFIEFVNKHFVHYELFESKKQLNQYQNKTKSSKRKQSKKTPKYNIDVPVAIASELNKRRNGSKFSIKFVDEINKYFPYFDLHKKLNHKYGASGAKVLFAMLNFPA